MVYRSTFVPQSSALRYHNNGSLHILTIWRSRMSFLFYIGPDTLRQRMLMDDFYEKLLLVVSRHRKPSKIIFYKNDPFHV